MSLKDECVAAFKVLKTRGIKPVQRSFVQYDHDSNLIGCCGLTAILLFRDEDPLTLYGNLNRLPLHQDEDYLCGFITGWDRETPIASDRSEASKLGFKDGREAYLAVK